jgi:hypothetical protein
VTNERLVTLSMLASRPMCAEYTTSDGAIDLYEPLISADWTRGMACWESGGLDPT